MTEGPRSTWEISGGTAGICNVYFSQDRRPDQKSASSWRLGLEPGGSPARGETSQDGLAKCYINKGPVTFATSTLRELRCQKGSEAEIRGP